MRASTLFALTLAVLLGLGATVLAKYFGLFEKPPLDEKKPDAVQVLVAKNNLYETTAITANDVMVRELKPSERDHFDKHKEQYLPALPAAANLRVMARNVPAGEALLKEHFTDLALPGKYTDLISPYMRAVDLSLPKERAGGGLLRVGEHVDVLLTASICDGPDCKNPLTRTGVIARDLKIIVKRNSLFTLMTADPDNAQVHYTLETNPYRRALIEYAKQKGTISLAPAPSGASTSPGIAVAGAAPVFSDPNSKEYRDEDARVAGILKGELTVGDNDLERIFDLKPRVPAPPPPPPVKIEMVSGVIPRGTRVYPPNSDKDGLQESAEPPLAGQDAAAPNRGNVASGYRFIAPMPSKDCPTCGKNKPKDQK